MIRIWLEKTWVQYLVLTGLLAIAALFWTFGFESPYDFQWGVLFEFNETYGQHFGLGLLKGLFMTLVISLISAAIALALAIFFGLGRLSKFKPLYLFSSWYVEFFRNTPLLVQLIFWYYAFPQVLPDSVRDWIFFDIDTKIFGLSMNFEFWCATFGLAIYSGSYMAEVIRAGLQSIPKGLLEAAYSSGLSYLQVLRKVIMPIAFRNIIPPLGSEFLNNMKNSSLAMVVGVAELAWQSQQVESLTFKGFEAACGASTLYLLTSLATSSVMNAVNRKLLASSGIGKRGSLDGLLDLFLWPFARIFNFFSRTLRRFNRRRRARRQTLSYGRAMAVWVRIRGLGWSFFVLAVKGLFVALILYLLFMVGKGVWGFDWQGIADNLRLLFTFRFPHGEHNQLLWGLGGVSLTIIMAVVSISVSFPIGLLIGLGRSSKNRVFSVPCTAYIEIIRGNPLIMVIFWSYFFIGVLTGKFLDAFTSATIAMTVFNAAYIAEIVRGGIQNIPPGQFEAAYSTGLSYWQTMRKIVLPQALKQMIPAIVGQFIAILKDTSLAYIIGANEMTMVTQIIINRKQILIFEMYTTIAVIYFIMCYAMSRYAARLERRLSPEKVRLEM